VAEGRKMLFAFGSVPKDGGTFTFYRNQRPELLRHGIDMRCVAIGREQAALWEDAYADEGCVLLAPETDSLKKQARAFANWCEAEGVDIVMGINSGAILSALPHLPERVRCMARCANAFDHGYRITLACRERLARVVAITPRLERDLVQTYGADPQRMVLIPNGIDPARFEAAASAPRGQEEVLRLGFLGRLEHNQKGVFHLPPLVRELNARGVPFTLRIAGKGKHGDQLRAEMDKVAQPGQVTFLGALEPQAVPEFFAQTDLYVFPSHFEGCPNALLEAIMAGCVPLAWVIDGITDYIIEDTQNGFLFETGDCAKMAETVASLHKDRPRVGALSNAAASNARARFTSAKTAEAYARLLHAVMAEPPPAWTPKPWEQFTPDPNFAPTLKMRARALLQRLGVPL